MMYDMVILYKCDVQGSNGCMCWAKKIGYAVYNVLLTMGANIYMQGYSARIAECIQGSSQFAQGVNRNEYVQRSLGK